MFGTKLIGLLFTLSFSMNIALADTRLPDENTLVKRFDALGLVKADKWKDAEASDSTEIKSARVNGDIYSIASDSISVLSFLPGKDSKVEAQHVVAVCTELAKVAMQNVTTETTNKIKGVIQKSALNFNEDSDMVDGYKFTTKSYAFGNTPAVGCMIEGFVTWN
ncbi:TPA: hypothetical protein U5E38_000534 [Yersinia enterocolitica]|uniref:hypothetical protein n=1 Tax=Yersinia massiliensis TaxID=419257 RepID=UPI001CFC8C8A|nr:hypothetical protein [Yersinia massiliensis]MCB5307341.1 hypothetical protein [Yersinia massiliensis]HEN3669685.1 hypothetical protein [Yersinia enterocolitica]HEO0716025.1 hypothetical protein [Yersinia enterocolitica]